MGDRSAVNTIRGYFYQFDYSIIKILELENATDAIMIEGIEDIDVSSASEETAIQCKYYEHTEYNHSVIAPAIRLMLAHFKKVVEGNAMPINYRLYGYYKSGQAKLTLPIDVDFLKNNFLSYAEKKIPHKVHEELGLTDTNLKDFLEKLTIDINAHSLDSQESQLMGLLIKEFACSKSDAEVLYYCNALAKIRSIAIEQNDAKRKITKSEFVKAINVKQLLFNDWYVALKGKQKWLSQLKTQYFSTLNTSPFERFFLIEVPRAEYSRSSLKELIHLLHRKWAKISKRENQPFCPYLYIHGIDEIELVELKKELASEGFIFVDGYDYMGATFNPKSISRTANYHNQIKIKFINFLENVQDVINLTVKTKEIYQFYFSEPILSEDYINVKQVAIQIQEFVDIKGVI